MFTRNIKNIEKVFNELLDEIEKGSVKNKNCHQVYYTYFSKDLPKIGFSHLKNLLKIN